MPIPTNWNYLTWAMSNEKLTKIYKVYKQTKTAIAFQRHDSDITELFTVIRTSNSCYKMIKISCWHSNPNLDNSDYISFTTLQEIFMYFYCLHHGKVFISKKEYTLSAHRRNKGTKRRKAKLSEKHIKKD